MKRLFFIYGFVAGFLCFGSCVDKDELRSDVDDLKSRVTALESQVGNLNQSIETLQLLASSSTIHTVTPTADGYELLMSNGQTIELKNGHDGDGITPVLSIDGDGCWMVDYRDGNGSVYLLSGGSKVRALGLDGVTPVYGVDADGYWTLDTGSGAVNVLDAQQNKVKATTDTSVSNPFFSSVVYDETNGVLVVELKDEAKTVLSVPVVNNFLFAIAGAGDPQEFALGETKEFGVTRQSVGVTIVAKPDGWNVALSADKISITAPSEVAGRSGTADTRTDVAVLAMCTFDNFSTIAKMKVAIEGTVVVHDPKASIYEGEITTSVINYTVSLADATSYKYVFQEALMGLQTPAQIAATGTLSTETTLQFTGLDAKTEYTLYVLAYYETEAASELVSKTTKTATPDYATYYEAYQDGEEFVIGGLTISKAVFGEGVLLTEATKTISADGVYFVPDGVTAENSSASRRNVIVFGNNPAQKGKLNIAVRFTFDPAFNGNFVLYNLNVSQTGTNQIIFYPNNSTGGGDLKTVAFEDCRFDMTGFTGFSFTAGRAVDTPIGVETISFVDCDVNMVAATYFFQYRNYGTIGKAIFRNNIIWSSTATPLTRIFNCVNGTDYPTAVPVNDFTFENNTWINCKPSTINIVKNNTSLTLRNNIFYAPLTSYTPFLTYETDGYPKLGVIENNLGYNSAGTTSAWKALFHNYTDLSGLPAEFKNFTTLSTDPFDGGMFDLAAGKFVPNAAYAAYGAQRQ